MKRTGGTPSSATSACAFSDAFTRASLPLIARISALSVSPAAAAKAAATRAARASGSSAPPAPGPRAAERPPHRADAALVATGSGSGSGSAYANKTCVSRTDQSDTAGQAGQASCTDSVGCTQCRGRQHRRTPPQVRPTSTDRQMTSGDQRQSGHDVHLGLLAPVGGLRRLPELAPRVILPHPAAVLELRVRNHLRLLPNLRRDESRAAELRDLGAEDLDVEVLVGDLHPVHALVVVERLLRGTPPMSASERLRRVNVRGAHRRRRGRPAGATTGTGSRLSPGPGGAPAA